MNSFAITSFWFNVWRLDLRILELAPTEENQRMTALHQAEYMMAWALEVGASV